MPSWNIHMAHTQRLLTRKGGRALSVKNENAFKFGCLIPDIYVGWMVPGIEKKLPYAYTHMAIPGAIPCPNELRFWNLYIGDREKPAYRSCVCNAETNNETDGRELAQKLRYPIREDVNDVTLGAWAHLATDNLWNSATRAFAFSHGWKPGDPLRIAKQHDFDLFGKTCDLGSAPIYTDELAERVLAFEQYSIDACYAQAACMIAQDIVEQSTQAQLATKDAYTLDSYQLVDKTWMEATMEHVDSFLYEVLSARL